MTNEFGQNWPGGRSADESANPQQGQSQPIGQDGTWSWGGYSAHQPDHYGPYGYSGPAAQHGGETTGWDSSATFYDDQPGYGTRAEQRKSGRGLTIAAITLPILALAGGIGAGYVLFDGGVDPATVAELESERDGLQQDLDDAKAQVESREADIVSLEEELGDAQTRSGDLDQRATELDERESGLDTREADLDEREADLEESGTTGTDEEPGPGPTISEGVWTVGVDIEPGTYRVTDEVTAEQFCYWAIYTSGTNQQDIITNSIPTGGFPQVTLDEGQDFETSDCGTWEQL